MKSRSRAAWLYSFPGDRLANVGTTPNEKALLNRQIHSIKQSTIVIPDYSGWSSVEVPSLEMILSLCA